MNLYEDEFGDIFDIPKYETRNQDDCESELDFELDFRAAL